MTPLILALLLTSTAQPSDFVRDSARAHAVVAEAVTAAGGTSALDALKQLQYQSNGTSRNLLQSFDPHAAPAPQPLHSAFSLDFQNDQYYQSVHIALPGVNSIPAPVFFKDGRTYELNDFEKQYTVSREAAGPTFDGPSRYVAPLIIRQLSKNSRSATWIGERTVHGRPADEIEFSWDEATRYRLDFDKQDHSLLALRLVAPDPLAGDDEVVIEYEGRQLAGGLAFPRRATSYRRGEPFLDITISDIKVNEAIDPARFEVPAGYVEAPSKPLQTERIAPNLYEIRELGGGAYRSQFIDAGGYVVVFEALLGRAASQQIITEIRKTVGTKPIQYVVISHFHNDHAAGVGAYVAIGATVVTTAGNEEILTRYARANGADLRPNFLDVTGDKLEIASSGGRPLTVYRIPDVPHVKEMLTLYDPATRTIMDGDLFAEFFPFSPSFQRFADWLRSPSAPDVAMIAGVHHPPMTKKAFLDLSKS